MIWLDHHQVKVGHHQVIWLVDQICLLQEIWDRDQMDLLQAIWDQDQTDQWDHLQEIWDQDQMDQWDLLRVIWLVSQDQWMADQVVLIHYLDQENLHRQVDQMDHLQELTWMVMECLLLHQVIWVEMDQVEIHQTTWVKCILTWMTQVHIINQGLRDQKDLLLEQIWMATEWLRLHHLTIQTMM